MTVPRIGLVLTGVGVAIFLLGLYGFGGLAPSTTLPITASLVGCGIFIAGLAILASQLRHANVRGPHPIGVLLAAAAVLLHGYEHIILAGEFSPGFFVWVMAPYVVFLFVSCIHNLRVPAVAAIAVVLLFDLIMHYDVFIAPKSSTAGLAVIFVTLWNLLVFGPIALLLAWAVQRSRARRLANGP